MPAKKAEAVKGLAETIEILNRIKTHSKFSSEVDDSIDEAANLLINEMKRYARMGVKKADDEEQ